MVHKGLLESFGVTPAVILANLIEKQKYFSEHFPKYEEWFFLSHEQQRKQVGTTDWTLVKVKKELVEKGVLHISRRGMPSREWYRIDYLVLAKLLALQPMDSGVQQPMDSGVQQPMDSLGQRPLDSGSHNNNIHNNNKKENKYISPTSKNADPTNEQYLTIAERLSNIIQSKKNIKHTPSQIRSWTKPIQKLIEKHLTGGNLSARKVRVKRALHWYASHIGEPYVPVIESGASLLEKFTKLENAIERETNNNRPKSKGPIVKNKYAKIKTIKVGDDNSGNCD